MADIFTDCTTKDLERLQPITNRLMIAIQAMQVEATKDLDIRDQMIVTMASLEQLGSVVDKVSKKMTTPRFIRTIRQSVKIGRAFGQYLK